MIYFDSLDALDFLPTETANDSSRPALEPVADPNPRPSRIEAGSGLERFHAGANVYFGNGVARAYAGRVHAPSVELPGDQAADRAK